MAQLQVVQGQVEINCHADKAFELWARKANHIAKMYPDKVTKVEVHDDEENVKTWYCLMNGHPASFKLKEEMDETNRSMTFHFIDGSVKDVFKSYKDNIQVFANDENRCTVQWTITCEKFSSECGPEPSVILEWLLDVSKLAAAPNCNA